MDIYDLIYHVIYHVVRHILYPIGIVYAGLEFHRYIYMHYMLVDGDDDEDDDEDDDNDDDYNEFHEPTIDLCSRCKNPDCSHRLANYIED